MTRPERSRLFDIAMIAGAIAAIIIGGFSAFAEDCEDVTNNVLRLHILANSDSEEDQRLKYQLRDYMLAEFSQVFGKCESLDDAISAAAANKDAMREKAQSFINENGYDYKVSCEVEKSYFTSRRYENYTLPAGEYSAVRFLIGEGSGKNWWCVMFPPLCLPACGEFYTEEQSRQIESGEGIEVRFALFEFLQNLFSWG